MIFKSWIWKFNLISIVLLFDLAACLPVLPSPAPSTSIAPPFPTPAPSPLPAIVPTSNIALTRGPYLQSVTTNSIIIVWETNLPSLGVVDYGETSECKVRATDPDKSSSHAITLTDLRPYTAYHYRVSSDSVPLSTILTFRTAASSAQTAYSFAVLGDTRTQHQIHRAIVELTIAQRPDFVLNTGDLVTNGWNIEQWDMFFEIEQELMAQTSLFPALGNHEGQAAPYFNLFHLPGNERWYTFEYGNSRFICLQVDTVADFGPESVQYKWLRKTLAANTQAWIFIYFHVPPYSSVPSHGLAEGEVRQTLVPLFEQYGVDIVFNGHQHSYERNEVGNVTYIVTAGGGAPLYHPQEPEPRQAAFAMAHHFVLLTVDGDCLEAKVISLEKAVIDEFKRCLD